MFASVLLLNGLLFHIYLKRPFASDDDGVHRQHISVYSVTFGHIWAELVTFGYIWVYFVIFGHI